MPTVGHLTVDFRLTKWPRQEPHVTSQVEFQQLWQVLSALPDCLMHHASQKLEQLARLKHHHLNAEATRVKMLRSTAEF